MTILDLVIFGTSFLLWAIVHSITASTGFKDLAREWRGQRIYDGFYRLVYNLFALITFLPVLYLGGRLIPAQTLWSISFPIAILFVLVQLIGLVGLMVSLLQTDLLRFMGLGQAVRYFRGEQVINPAPQLVISGTYKLVRHPLYLFSLLVLWFFPIMTLTLLVFNICATLYFWIGSIYEERRLIAQFGETYAAYRRRVPRLFPIKL